MPLINYWYITDVDTGGRPNVPDVPSSSNYLFNVGSQQEMKGYLMEVKRDMIKAGYHFSGSWAKKEYIITREDVRYHWRIGFVNEYING